MHDDKTLTEWKVGEMISLTNVKTIMKKITNGVTAALPKGTDTAETARGVTMPLRAYAESGRGAISDKNRE